MKTICLNMIVKNECKVIRRCFDSLRHLIDHWIIVDTGSTDGTQTAIIEYLQDIPGTLYERPWINFEHNRNEALALARNKSDYILFIDADETLKFSRPLDKTKLDKDFYLALKTGLINCQYFFLINNDPGWKWKDVLHEYVTNPNKEMKGEFLPDVLIDCSAMDSFRSEDAQKSLHDAELLEAAIKKEPDNSRYYFYLGQSYANAKRFPEALKNYQKRAAMGGYPEEVFWALYCSGLLEEVLKMNFPTVVAGFSKAFEFMPDRSEPLYRLGSIFQSIGAPLLGYLLLKFSLTLPRMQICYKFEKWIYDYGRLVKFAELAAATGRKKEARCAYRRVIAQSTVPPEIAKQAKESLKSL